MLDNLFSLLMIVGLFILAGFLAAGLEHVMHDSSKGKEKK